MIIKNDQMDRPWIVPGPVLSKKADAQAARFPHLLRYLTLAFALVSAVSFGFFYTQGDTLVYTDAQSHLLIARRVVSSPTWGAGQLGGVWLPLPHILMLPFIWSDQLFFTGIAGSLVSMICYVTTASYLYKLGVALTGERVVGIVTAAVFGLNANILYMQSTPMSELPLYLFITAAAYYLVVWAGDTSQQKPFYLMQIALMLATLTRYEAWVFLIVCNLFVVLIALKERWEWVKLQAYLLWSGLLGGIGIIGWMVWNQIIFGDYLYFQRGEYSKPSLWSEQNEKTDGNLSASFETYVIATFQNVHWLIVGLALTGMIYFVLVNCRSLSKLTVLGLLFPFPFFIFALYVGQRPMRVEALTGQLYNTRFALIMVLPAAVFAGYLVRRRDYLAPVIIGLAAVVSLQTIMDKQVISLRDPQSATLYHKFLGQEEAAFWLEDNYDGGNVLMESFGNELFPIHSKLPTQRIIYEGSYQIWEPALENPEEYADWVIMRDNGSTPDKIFYELGGAETLSTHYDLVFHNSEFRIYLIKQVDRVTQLP